MKSSLSARYGTGEELSQLFELIWQETSDLRRVEHDGRACPTARSPYGAADPSGRLVAEACFAASCLDLVHDVYVMVLPRLRDRLSALAEMGELQDATRYTHTVVRRAIADFTRKRRVTRGLPAKPCRSDGVPGRVNAALRARAPDPVAGEWRVKLFRLMRGYACRLGSPERAWPLDGLTQEKNTFDLGVRPVGSDTSRAEIAADIAEILSTAETAAGKIWVYDNVIGPLGRSVSPRSLETFDEVTAPAITVPHESMELAQLSRQEFARLLTAGMAPDSAARAAVWFAYDIEVPRSRHTTRAIVDWMERPETADVIRASS